MTDSIAIDELLEELKAERIFISGYPYSYGNNMAGIWYENQYHFFNYSYDGNFLGYGRCSADTDLKALFSRHGEYTVWNRRFIGKYQEISFPLPELKKAILQLNRYLDDWKNKLGLRYRLNNFFEFGYSAHAGFAKMEAGRVERTDILGYWQEKQINTIPESIVYTNFFKAIYLAEPIEAINVNDDFTLEVMQRHFLFDELRAIPHSNNCLIYQNLTRTVTLWLDNQNFLYAFNMSAEGKNTISKYPKHLNYAILNYYARKALGLDLPTKIEIELGQAFWLDIEFSKDRPIKRVGYFDKSFLDIFNEENLNLLLKQPSFKMTGGMFIDSYQLTTEFKMYNQYDPVLQDPKKWIEIQRIEDSWIYMEF